MRLVHRARGILEGGLVSGSLIPPFGGMRLIMRILYVILTFWFITRI